MAVMQLLVTGGSGSLSQILIHRFVEAGHRAHVVGGNTAPHPRVIAHRRIADPELDLRAIDAVIDLEGPPPTRDIDAAETTMRLDKTRELVRRTRNAGIPKLIFVSSVRAATHTHAFTKLKEAQETILRQSGVPYLVLKAPWIVGPQDLFLSPLIRAARVNQLTLGNAADTVIQMVTQSDLADAIVRGLEMRLQVSRAYDIASWETCSLRELISHIRYGLPLRSAAGDAPLPWPEPMLRLVHEQPVGTPTAYCLDFGKPLARLPEGLIDILRTALLVR